MVFIPRDKFDQILNGDSQVDEAFRSGRGSGAVDIEDAYSDTEEVHQYDYRNRKLFDFDFNDYSQLRSNSERIRYVKDSCEYVGAGSSRITFILNDGKALKIAINVKGVAQNKAEYRNLKGNRYECFPMFYGVTEGRDSLLMECGTRVLASDFDDIYGMSENDLYECLVFFKWMIAKGLNYRKHSAVQKHMKQYIFGDYDERAKGNENFYRNKGYYDDLAYNIKTLFTKLHGENAKVFARLLQFIEDNMGKRGKIGNEMDLADLQNIDNWACVNRDGHKVIIICDSGLTNDVYDKYYD